MSVMQTRTPNFNCQFCGNLYLRIQYLKRHQNVCEFNPSRPAEKMCPNCNLSFGRDAFKSHYKKCSLIESKNIQLTRTPCPVEECNCTFFHRSNLENHLRSNHLDHKDFNLTDVVTVREKFKTFEEFLQWKRSEEERTLSCFVKKGGTKSTTHYFYCHHDGRSRSDTSKTTRRNFKGRIKVDDFCIAKMKVWRDNKNECFWLEYFPKHSHRNKSQDFIHHPLFIGRPKSTKNKQMQPSNIVNSKSKVNAKKEAIIRRQLNVRLDQEEAKRVYVLAQQMAAEGSLLIFKPTGGKVVHGPISINDLPEPNALFMFAIQTESQLQLFKKHCGKILVVNLTYGTNRYKYMLVTCMIVDENYRGWSVAHCITNRSDAASLKYFFACIKSRLGGETAINCVITDDNPVLIKSMNEGFSTELRHILCIYHVLKKIKNHLRLKVDGDLFQDMLGEIKEVIITKELHEFANLWKELLMKYDKNDKTESFMAYLKTRYISRPMKWAMSFRQFPHAEVNTIGHVESFHNMLKELFLVKKDSKRLDDLINILNDMEKQDHRTRHTEAEPNTAVDCFALLQDVAERHDQCMDINDDDIHRVFDNIWEIMSTRNKSEFYVIVKHSSICTHNLCSSKCLKCYELCSHMYLCNCSDRHPLCKHIHKLHSFLTTNLSNITPSEFLDFNETPIHSTIDVITEEEFSPIYSTIDVITEEESSPIYSTIDVITEEESSPIHSTVDVTTEKESSPIHSTIDVTTQEESSSNNEFDSTISRIKANVGVIESFIFSAHENDIEDELLLNNIDSIVSNLASEVLRYHQTGLFQMSSE